ncbi:MAG: type III-B CRISPR module RAMP protein Cmr1 [archaeon]
MKIEASVKLKFLTPAFIGGVDPHGNSELNEKALRGALRFWWRAFCSDPGWDYKQLLGNESTIFGGQNIRSKFSVTIIDSPKNGKAKNNVSKMENGIKYLLYSTIPKENNRGKAEYISPGSEYTVRIIADSIDVMKEVLKSFWLLENFGGLGARSRRGAGSFKITNVDGLELTQLNDVPEFLFISEIKDTNGVKEFLNQGIRRINPKINTFPKYTAYSLLDNNSYFKVRVVTGGGWEQAMNELGQIYSDFRSYRNPPYSEQARSLHDFAVSNGNSGFSLNHPPTKVAFGLPIIYKFRDKLSIIAEPDSRDLVRRGSPLFFKIGEIDNNFYIVALVMWSEFLPPGMKVKVKRMHDLNTLFLINQPSRDDIDNFMEYFERPR